MEITRIQPDTLILWWLNSDSIANRLGRVQQASWPNGNGTSDILALYEKVAALSLREIFFFLNGPTSLIVQLRSNMMVPTGLLCEFHLSTSYGTPDPSKNSRQSSPGGTLLYFY